MVALGGGAVTIAACGRRSAPAARRLADAPAEVLAGAACAAGDAAAGRDEAAFRALLAEREPLYRAVAGATVVNDGTRSLGEVADEVVALVRARQATDAAAPASPAGTSGGVA